MKSLNLAENCFSLLSFKIVALLVLVASVSAKVSGTNGMFFNRITLLVLTGGIVCAGSSLLNDFLGRLDLFHVMGLVDTVMPPGKTGSARKKKMDVLVQFIKNTSP